jgi:hypothetical protein
VGSLVFITLFTRITTITSSSHWHAFCFIHRSVARERQLFDAALRDAVKT